jgi:hypothetical protein
MEDNIIINSKSVTFLDFVPINHSLPDSVELLLKEKPATAALPNPIKEEEKEINIKEEEEEGNLVPDEEVEVNTIGSDSEDYDEEVADALIPEPVGRVLRDRTLQVKPVKYSHFSEDPTSFKKAVSGSNAAGWTKAINEELENIKKHQVWLDQSKKPEKVLHSTWVFKTKPATLSSSEKQKA